MGNQHTLLGETSAYIQPPHPPHLPPSVGRLAPAPCSECLIPPWAGVTWMLCVWDTAAHTAVWTVSLFTPFGTLCLFRGCWKYSDTLAATEI